MTQIAFNPNPQMSPPFSATIVMDGAPTLLQVVWNTYAQRWYVQLTQQGVAVWTGALVAGPVLAPNVFSVSTLTFDASSGNFTVTP